MAADILDATNPQINELLHDFRAQLREAFASGRYVDWEGSATIRPGSLYEFSSGNRFKKRLTSGTAKP